MGQASITVMSAPDAAAGAAHNVRSKRLLSLLEVRQNAVATVTSRLSALEELAASPSAISAIGIEAIGKLHAAMGSGAQPVPQLRVHDDVLRALGDIRGQVAKRLREWDVRNITTLIDVFPGIVAAPLRHCAVKAAQDEGGEWMLEFDLAQPRQSVFAREDAAVLPQTLAIAQHLGGHINGVATVRLQALQPMMAQAQQDFDNGLNLIDPRASNTVVAPAWQTAHDAFNKHLHAAALAFYLDTADYNLWSHIRDVAAPRHAELWFDSMSAQGIPSEDNAQCVARIAQGLVEYQERMRQLSKDVQLAQDSEPPEPGAASMPRQRG